MSNSIGFISLTIFALLVLILFYIVFITKRRICQTEDNTYLLILIITILTSISGLILGICIIQISKIPILIINFLNKIYLSGLLLWGLTLTYYTFHVSKIKRNIKNPLKLFVMLGSICCLLIFLLPIHNDFIDGQAIVSGLSLQFTFFAIGIEFLFMIILLIMNIKNINKKYYPIFTLVFLSIINLLIQIIFPQLNYLINPSIAFIIFLMYFTIENPDIKVLNELYKNKTIMEQTYDDKANFLFEAAQEIKNPL
ncbi:MAG: hypothetical protein GX951_03340, partial [Mollicutes bacterium]|nr:hypothetical protein [Mollicutes bacterium]